MGPLALTLVSGVMMLAFDHIKEQRKQGGQTVPAPPELPEDVIRKVTHVRGGAIQYFNRDIAAATPRVLVSRSAQFEQAGQLAQIGRVYRIVPLQPGLPSAATTIEEAWRNGQVVLASLSMLLVPSGRTDWPAVLVIGAPGCQQWAKRGSHFAVLDAPVTVNAVAEAAPEGAPTEVAEPAKKVAKAAPRAANPVANGVAPPAVSAGDSEAIETTGEEA